MPRVHVPVIRWTGVVSMWCASSLLDGQEVSQVGTPIVTTKEVVASILWAMLGRPREADGAREPAGVIASDVGQSCLSGGGFTLFATAIEQVAEAVAIADTTAAVQSVNPTDKASRAAHCSAMRHAFEVGLTELSQLRAH